MHYFIKSVGIALQNIKANPLHTFLSTLGIIIGVASLVAILALGDGLEQSGREELANTTSLNILELSSVAYKTVDDIRIPVEDRPRLHIDHVRELEKSYHDRVILEMISRTTAEAEFNDSTYSIYVQGNMENGLKFINSEMELGRFFTSEEIDHSEQVAAISQPLAEKWGLTESDLEGAEFSVYGIEFEIIGVMPEKAANVPRIYIPITLLSSLRDIYPTITLKADNAEDIPALKADIENWLDVSFEEGSDAFSLVSNDFRIEQFSKGILLFKLIMGAITGISVLVGGIGVMNVLLISVTERTREIGIRKATGAKKKDIVMQFMSESVTISLVGCMLGWLAGMIGLWIFVPVVNKMTSFDFNVAISSSTILFIVLIALLIGVVFGTYPAWRASQLDPIDAIRHE